MAGQREMTTTELVTAREPQATVLTNEQLKYIAGTDFVPKGLRGNLPAILACVATGRALGLADMTALRSIHVIDGRTSYSGELMTMLVRRAGHSITGEITDKAVTVRGKRADNGDEMTITWTMGMAERAGLAQKGNWRQYPEAMLWNRAISQLCRALFADCMAGHTYTSEELGATDTNQYGVPDVEPTIDMSDPDIPFGDAPLPMPPEPEAMQENTRKRLMALYREAGFTTSQQRHSFAGAMLGHRIDSSNDLTEPEAQKLIGHLGNASAAAETPRPDERG